MKKLMFTAIAMVAFSSTSMANTIADVKPNLKSLSNKEKSTKECTLKAKRNPTFCELIGTIAAHDVFIATGNTNAATQAGLTAQLTCILAGG